MVKLKHEIVVPDNNLPAWVYLHEENQYAYIEPHWHSSVELSYTICGQIANFFIAGKSYKTCPGQILVVNSTEIHSIQTFHEPGKDSCALTIIFPYHLIQTYVPTINQYKFVLNDLEVKDHPAYQLLQEKLTSIACLHKTDQNLRKTIVLLEILEILINHFMVKRQLHLTDKHDDKQKERLREIKFYIEEHYQVELDLQSIADHFYLSKEHLSRFFKEYMNMTVVQYLNYVRSKHALPLLKDGKMTATQIALECGFSGLRTLDRALVKYYGQTSKQLKTQKDQSAPK
ncbi:AraC-like DNA-binding protein [Streptococcus rupicaprae]|uniref:AraC-like DNA-binding protein n=1 Tax=Streptococcus rupicaprae TaxID=759619 RepID=A0ABV2FGZ6_9STRE